MVLSDGDNAEKRLTPTASHKDKRSTSPKSCQNDESQKTPAKKSTLGVDAIDGVTFSGSNANRRRSFDTETLLIKDGEQCKRLKT